MVDKHEVLGPNYYTLLADMTREYIRAVDTNGPFNSMHEGYAVILEELDELWEEVRKKARYRDPLAVRKECLQIAAMAIRFIVDCGCVEHEPPK